jgi:hypothetical protein
MLLYIYISYISISLWNSYIFTHLKWSDHIISVPDESSDQENLLTVADVIISESPTANKLYTSIYKPLLVMHNTFYSLDSILNFVYSLTWLNSHQRKCRASVLANY